LPRANIRLALLLGFLVIFSIWMASTVYFTRQLTESQAQGVAIQGRFARGQELLFAVRSQVLLGSIDVRDALMEGHESSVAATARDKLLGLEAQMKQELDQYTGLQPAIDLGVWNRLQQELEDYWQAAIRLVDRNEGTRTETTLARLRSQVIPR